MQWFVQSVEGKPDVYTITAGPFPPELGTPGFRRERDRHPNDVFNSLLRGEWRFVPVPGFYDVFESAPFPASPVYSTDRFQRVHPHDHIIGVIELLGTEGFNVNRFSILIRMTRLVFCAGCSQDIPSRAWGTHFKACLAIPPCELRVLNYSRVVQYI